VGTKNLINISTGARVLVSVLGCARSGTQHLLFGF
jgi:hypothetical protein